MFDHHSNGIVATHSLGSQPNIYEKVKIQALEKRIATLEQRLKENTGELIVNATQPENAESQRNTEVVTLPLKLVISCSIIYITLFLCCRHVMLITDHKCNIYCRL